MSQKFSAVLRRQRLGLLSKFQLRSRIEHRRRGRSRCNRNLHFGEELLLPGRRTDAQQAHWTVARIVELLRRIGWNMHGLARLQHFLHAPERGLHLALGE